MLCSQRASCASHSLQSSINTTFDYSFNFVVFLLCFLFFNTYILVFIQRHCNHFVKFKYFMNFFSYFQPIIFRVSGTFGFSDVLEEQINAEK